MSKAMMVRPKINLRDDIKSLAKPYNKEHSSATKALTSRVRQKNGMSKYTTRHFPSITMNPPPGVRRLKL